MDDWLSQWAQFDDRHQRLMSALTLLQTTLDSTDTVNAKDAIATIEQVSASCCKHARIITEHISGFIHVGVYSGLVSDF